MKMAVSAPGGTLICFMCQGVMFVKDKTRFNKHMNNEHGVIFELDFLMAACKLGQPQRGVITEMVDNSTNSDGVSQDFSTESVKEKLRMLIPAGSAGKKNFLSNNSSYKMICPNKTCEKLFIIDNNNVESKKLFDVHTENCRKLSSGSRFRGGGGGISDDDDGEIEFITAVPADSKPSNKKKRLSDQDSSSENKKPKPNPIQVKPPSTTPTVPNFESKDKAVKEDTRMKESKTPTAPKEPVKNKPGTLVIDTRTPPPSSEGNKKIQCNICKREYKNKTGLYIHMGRAHKGETVSTNASDNLPTTETNPVTDEVPSSSSTEEEDSAGPVIQSVFSEALAEKLAKIASGKTKKECKCGKTFDNNMKLKSHQKRTCRIYLEKTITNNDSFESPLSNEEAGTGSSLELEEKPNEIVGDETDEEIHRRLFMDNIAKDGSDEEDEDLEVVDYKIGRVKNEPVTVEEAASSKDDPQEETDRLTSFPETSKPEEEFDMMKANVTESTVEESTATKIELLKQSSYFQVGLHDIYLNNI